MPSVLLPGDPDRVSKAASVLEQVTEIGRRREFQMARGTWNGTPDHGLLDRNRGAINRDRSGGAC